MQQEFAELPKEFVKEGQLFIRRCQKPTKTEFLKISQAVGVGFVVMGAIGFIIKLSMLEIGQDVIELYTDRSRSPHPRQQRTRVIIVFALEREVRTEVEEWTQYEDISGRTHET